MAGCECGSGGGGGRGNRRVETWMKSEGDPLKTPGLSATVFQDLTKWKIRRRSTKSDLSRKSQDREHVIHQMTNGAGSSLEENGAGVPLER